MPRYYCYYLVLVVLQVMVDKLVLLRSRSVVMHWCMQHDDDAVLVVVAAAATSLLLKYRMVAWREKQWDCL